VIDLLVNIILLIRLDVKGYFQALALSVDILSVSLQGFVAFLSGAGGAPDRKAAPMLQPGRRRLIPRYLYLFDEVAAITAILRVGGMRRFFRQFLRLGGGAQRFSCVVRWASAPGG
jgi:hypothetical protein